MVGQASLALRRRSKIGQRGLDETQAAQDGVVVEPRRGHRAIRSRSMARNRAVSRRWPRAAIWASA